MPDFDPPFAQNGEFRFPNANEQSLGWPCGPIDQNLLNGLFRLHNGNIGDVISSAGVTGPDGDLTKLRRAIEALIAAATGGGTVDDYILMAQARNRLPIFPDVQNVDGRIGVTAPSTGAVRLAGGVEFLHRGIFRVTTTQTDFATDASKTYHLRWTPTDGFVLRDLASGTYNPSTLSESNIAFDSAFDDMLIARVVTNSSNVATITTLANKDRLSASGEEIAPRGSLDPNIAEAVGGFGVLASQITQGASASINFARTPDAFLRWINDMRISSQPSPASNELNIGVQARSRYSVLIWGQGDLDITVGWAARA